MIQAAKHRTPVELFVNTFLRTHKKGKIGLVHLEDAVLLIQKKLGEICCSNPPVAVSLNSSQHSIFTDTIRQLLHNTIKRGNVQSLERAISHIQLVIDGCNCP